MEQQLALTLVAIQGRTAETARMVIMMERVDKMEGHRLREVTAVSHI